MICVTYTLLGYFDDVLCSLTFLHWTTLSRKDLRWSKNSSTLKFLVSSQKNSAIFRDSACEVDNDGDVDDDKMQIFGSKSCMCWHMYKHVHPSMLTLHMSTYTYKWPLPMIHMFTSCSNERGKISLASLSDQLTFWARKCPFRLT